MHLLPLIGVGLGTAAVSGGMNRAAFNAKNLDATVYGYDAKKVAAALGLVLMMIPTGFTQIAGASLLFGTINNWDTTNMVREGLNAEVARQLLAKTPQAPGGALPGPVPGAAPPAGGATPPVAVGANYAPNLTGWGY